MSFDLNIENYTQQELTDMFELPVIFDNKMIELHTRLLIDNTMNDTTFNTSYKQQIIHFINQAKDLLLDKLKYKNTEIISTNNNTHLIQQPRQTPYVNSIPNEYFMGTINPLKQRTITQNLNIDSRFRDNIYNSYSTNFNITLPLKINNVVQMKLVSIQLPNTYYTISNQYNNNYFIIKINGITTKISIPFGNYNTITIMDAINTNLTALGAPFNYVSFSSISNTLQTQINPNGSGIVTSLEIIFYESINDDICHTQIAQISLGWLLGFREYRYTDHTTYISEGPIDLSGAKYFYLAIDNFNNNSVNNNFVGAFKSSILNKNIIARISINKKTNIKLSNIILDTDFGIVASPCEYFGPINIQTLNIQLLDEYGRIVDFNNMNFNFCLSLITIYDL
jgi:hypothetical protein